MTEKLVEKLKELKVGISSKGNVCLNDFVINVLKSTNPRGYMKTIADKKLFGDKFFITPEKALELVKKGKAVECHKLIKYIETDQNDHSSLIDPKNNIIKFDGHRFVSFFVDDPNNPDNWNVWIQGSDICKSLGYANLAEAIQLNVTDQNKINFAKLIEFFPHLLNLCHKNIDKKTIFININGFFELIHDSKKPFAKKLKYWIDNEVLPSLIKTGYYNMQPPALKVGNFYDNDNFAKYFNKAVMYIAYVGKHYNQHIFKYGLSRDIFERIKKHRTYFTTFDIKLIQECDNCEQVEQLFEYELKTRGMHKILLINGKNHKELFTISVNHDDQYFINYMKTLIDNNKLPAIAEANNQITTLSTIVNKYEISEQTRQMKLQFKMSENYKLKLQKDKLQLEKDIKIRELDLLIEKEKTETEKYKTEAERERTKQASVNKNFNYVSSSNKIITNEPPKPLKNTYNKKNVIRL